MEQLVVRHGLQHVTEAVSALRINPEQKFFPRPDEVAEQIEWERSKRQIAIDTERRTHERERYIKEHWEWGFKWMKDTGNSQEELLKRYPSLKGTKPECVEGPGA
jgi:hypothetical protein